MMRTLKMQRGNVTYATLPRPDESLVTNKDQNNQLKFGNFTKDCDHERTRAILIAKTVQNCVKISKRQPKIHANSLKFEEIESMLMITSSASFSIFTKSQDLPRITSSDRFLNIISSSYRTVEN